MGIYVWGTGCGASELIEAGLEIHRITAFVDSFPLGQMFLDRPVVLPGQLRPEDCDLMIVASRHADAIGLRCGELGIPGERILFLKDHAVLADRNVGCARAEELLGRELLNKLLPRQRIVSTPAQLADSDLPEEDLRNDYVRMATLELLCRRLDGVPGAAAELGVYRGAFARCINRLLPERKLYLFDSFRGFGEMEGATASFEAAHRNTAVDQVLSVMPAPDRIIVKQGFFPGSLEGLEERFCLVSLDVDFYETTLEGLRYFWPRLEAGGYLLLHDWGSVKLSGVAKALGDYERELGRRIPALPLCDVGGSLILCK